MAIGTLSVVATIRHPNCFVGTSHLNIDKLPTVLHLLTWPQFLKQTCWSVLIGLWACAAV